ncbi:HAUS augmin-like complex subunit 6 [Tubulanus polymorphus]|uniref:HAUS augmin-like complex subunit 6 n=1 Tax=Tubulanus polymorphus TaxID=672921 RepID=UPI003DA5903F
MSAMIVERQKYFETLQRSIIETEQQAQFARWLESRFVKIPPEQKLSDQKSRHSEVLLNKVRKQWNELNKVITDIKQERSVIQSVLQGGMERYQISAADLSLRVPNRLLEKFQNEMHLRGKANTYTEGKVNIISVLRLFNMALSSVINKIREENLEINAEKIHRLSEEVSRHHNQLAQFIALQSNISDVILPSIKQSNTSLKMKLDQSYL